MTRQRFWLYDIEYDNNPLLERKFFSYLYRCCYIIMMAYTLTYAIVWQKKNELTSSDVVIRYTMYVSAVGLFVWSIIMLIIF